MNRYTIPCSEEQTKKALELGAPIEKRDSIHINIPLVSIAKDDFLTVYKVPTAEEMIGWLEEQVGIKSIVIDKTDEIQFIVWGSNGKPIWCNTGFDSPKDATLAAIDAALEYLTNLKKYIYACRNVQTTTSP